MTFHFPNALNYNSLTTLINHLSLPGLSSLPDFTLPDVGFDFDQISLSHLHLSFSKIDTGFTLHNFSFELDTPLTVKLPGTDIRLKFKSLSLKDIHNQCNWDINLLLAINQHEIPIKLEQLDQDISVYFISDIYTTMPTMSSFIENIGGGLSNYFPQTLKDISLTNFNLKFSNSFIEMKEIDFSCNVNRLNLPSFGGLNINDLSFNAIIEYPLDEQKRIIKDLQISGVTLISNTAVEISIPLSTINPLTFRSITIRLNDSIEKLLAIFPKLFANYSIPEVPFFNHLETFSKSFHVDTFEISLNPDYSLNDIHFTGNILSQPLPILTQFFSNDFISIKNIDISYNFPNSTFNYIEGTLIIDNYNFPAQFNTIDDTLVIQSDKTIEISARSAIHLFKQKSLDVIDIELFKISNLKFVISTDTLTLKEMEGNVDLGNNWVIDHIPSIFNVNEANLHFKVTDPLQDFHIDLDVESTFSIAGKEVTFSMSLPIGGQDYNLCISSSVSLDDLTHLFEKIGAGSIIDKIPLDKIVSQATIDSICITFDQNNLTIKSLTLKNQFTVQLPDIPLHFDTFDVSFIVSDIHLDLVEMSLSAIVDINDIPKIVNPTIPKLDKSLFHSSQSFNLHIKKEGVLGLQFRKWPLTIGSPASYIDDNNRSWFKFDFGSHGRLFIEYPTLEYSTIFNSLSATGDIRQEDLGLSLKYFQDLFDGSMLSFLADIIPDKVTVGDFGVGVKKILEKVGAKTENFSDDLHAHLDGVSFPETTNYDFSIASFVGMRLNLDTDFAIPFLMPDGSMFSFLLHRFAITEVLGFLLIDSDMDINFFHLPSMALLSATSPDGPVLSSKNFEAKIDINNLFIALTPSMAPVGLFFDKAALVYHGYEENHIEIGASFPKPDIMHLPEFIKGIKDYLTSDATLDLSDIEKIIPPLTISSTYQFPPYLKGKKLTLFDVKLDHNRTVAVHLLNALKHPAVTNFLQSIPIDVRSGEISSETLNLPIPIGPYFKWAFTSKKELKEKGWEDMYKNVLEFTGTQYADDALMLVTNGGVQFDDIYRLSTQFGVANNGGFDLGTGIGFSGKLSSLFEFSLGASAFIDISNINVGVLGQFGMAMANQEIIHGSAMLTAQEIALDAQFNASNIPILPSLKLTGSLDTTGHLSLQSEAKAYNLLGIGFNDVKVAVNNTECLIGATYGHPNLIHMDFDGRTIAKLSNDIGFEGNFLLDIHTYRMMAGQFIVHPDGILLKGYFSTPNNFPIELKGEAEGALNRNGLLIDSYLGAKIVGINCFNSHLRIENEQMELGVHYGDPSLMHVGMMISTFNQGIISGNYDLDAFKNKILSGRFQVEKNSILLTGTFQTPDQLPVKLDGNIIGQIDSNGLYISAEAGIKIIDINFNKGIVVIDNNNISLETNFGNEKIILVSMKGTLNNTDITGNFKLSAYGIDVANGSFNVK